MRLILVDTTSVAQIGPTPTQNVEHSASVKTRIAHLGKDFGSTSFYYDDNLQHTNELILWQKLGNSHCKLFS
jgi:hypothetical protein